MIIRRRRNHEYKLVRRPARKEDYLTAIQYEVHLDMLRKHRKKVDTVYTCSRFLVIIVGITLFIFVQKFGVATARKDADNGIQNRIHGLFRVKKTQIFEIIVVSWRSLYLISSVPFVSSKVIWSYGSST